jgi:hypothetical protein
MVDAGDLRASDAERERTVEVLREAFTQGRLESEEFNERVDAAYAAKTHAQLGALTADLPAGGAAVAGPGVVIPDAHWHPSTGHRHGSALQHGDRAALRGIWSGWAAMTVVLTTVWGLSGGGWSNYWPEWPVGVFGAVCVARTLNVWANRR